MNLYQAYSHYGPGGRNCPCCGPGLNERKTHDRMVKRRVKQKFKKEIQQALKEINDKE